MAALPQDVQAGKQTFSKGQRVIAVRGDLLNVTGARARTWLAPQRQRAAGHLQRCSHRLALPRRCWLQQQPSKPRPPPRPPPHPAGLVQGLDGEGMVKVLCDDSALGEVPFPQHELEKYFAVGDKVRVMAGQHRDETGLVVHVKEQICVVVSDTTNQQLQVGGGQGCRAVRRSWHGRRPAPHSINTGPEPSPIPTRRGGW
jgi:hypothetical protein